MFRFAGEDVTSVLPKCKHLDLQGNLLFDWAEVRGRHACLRRRFCGLLNTCLQYQCACFKTCSRTGTRLHSARCLQQSNKPTTAKARLSTHTPSCVCVCLLFLVFFVCFFGFFDTQLQTDGFFLIVRWPTCAGSCLASTSCASTGIACTPRPSPVPLAAQLGPSKSLRARACLFHILRNKCGCKSVRLSFRLTDAAASFYGGTFWFLSVCFLDGVRSDCSCTRCWLFMDVP